MRRTNKRIGIVLGAVIVFTIFTVSSQAVELSHPKLCRVLLRGVVTQTVNVDPRIQVSVGDILDGSLKYDPKVVIDTVNPGPPGGPFDVHPLSSFAFTVGTLSGALNSPDGFIVPELIHSTVVNLGAFFITSGGIELDGGNTFNGGGGSFVIGNASDGGIIGTLVEQRRGCGSIRSFLRFP